MALVASRLDARCDYSIPDGTTFAAKKAGPKIEPVWLEVELAQLKG